MKRILLTLITISQIFTFNCLAQQYGWQVIDPATIPGSPDFSDVFFISDDEGWISVSSGPEIYHTTDGGTTFEIQTTQFSTEAIYMIDENEGYTGGANGRVYRTTDGGENWIAIGSISVTLTDISFPPVGDTGYCCGINGNIWSIDSSGVTKMTSNVNGDLSSISFPINSEEGWVCGGDLIRHFKNSVWNGDQGYPIGCYNAIYMVDNNEGWSVGSKISHTEDGSNWVEQENPDTQGKAMTDIFFLNSVEGWVAGNGGLILHTIDRGINWNIEAAGLNNSLLRGVHFTSPTNGYVVGNGKTFIKFGELTAVENDAGIPTEFSLSQNYPNPFNPSTKIKFTVPQDERRETKNVTLKVYDVLGNEVATLINEEKPAGEYEVEFNGNELTSGVYFYQLRAGWFIQTKKMILLR